MFSMARLSSGDNDSEKTFVIFLSLVLNVDKNNFLSALRNYHTFFLDFIG